MTEQDAGRVVVIVSAGQEWRAIREVLPQAQVWTSPLGEWFVHHLDVGGSELPVVFLHGGWGKIAAAASAQYAIDRWAPPLLVNLGTCGGFQGRIERGAVVLASRTVVYDIVEQMGDHDTAIAHYACDIDLSFLAEDRPGDVVCTSLVSADRDLIPAEVEGLAARYGAVAGDWESGAIAWVAGRNGVPCLILRAVTDLVGPEGGEAYDGTVALFTARTREVMPGLLRSLPRWLAAVRPPLT